MTVVLTGGDESNHETTVLRIMPFELDAGELV